MILLVETVSVRFQRQWQNGWMDGWMSSTVVPRAEQDGTVAAPHEQFHRRKSRKKSCAVKMFRREKIENAGV